MHTASEGNFKLMKKLGFILLALTLVFALYSCGKGDVPDGMQLVRGGEDIGYYFYAPEEWTVANQGNISAVYVSSLDSTSATVSEADLPLGSISDYFTDSVSKLPFEINVTVNGEKTSFGGARDAYKFVYDYTYENFGFRTMQILAYHGESFYIFTFTSQLAERTEGVSYYEYYSEKLASIIENFKFTEKSIPAVDKDYAKDEDGYLLVTDSKLSGFNFYMAPDWTVRYSSANVGISLPDGASVNLTEATGTGISRDTYFEKRKADIKTLTGSDVKEVPGKIAVETKLGNSSWAFSYEYSYTFGQTTYRVYQIIAVEGTWPFQSGYVFTYTAPEDVFEEHLGEVEEMVKKVNFR